MTSLRTCHRCVCVVHCLIMVTFSINTCTLSRQFMDYQHIAIRIRVRESVNLEGRLVTMCWFWRVRTNETQFARENSVDLDINKSSLPSLSPSVQSIATSAMAHSHSPAHNASVLIATFFDWNNGNSSGAYVVFLFNTLSISNIKPFAREFGNEI